MTNFAELCKANRELAIRVVELEAVREAARAVETTIRSIVSGELGFSRGAWGDLMQAIVGRCEGYLKYYKAVEEK